MTECRDSQSSKGHNQCTTQSFATATISNCSLRKSPESRKNPRLYIRFGGVQPYSELKMLKSQNQKLHILQGLLTRMQVLLLFFKINKLFLLTFVHFTPQPTHEINLSTETSLQDWKKGKVIFKESQTHTQKSGRNIQL